jgi:hypothetical protein
MKFKHWYEKQRPILVVLSSLWFVPAKYRKPIQQLIKVLDYAISERVIVIGDIEVD